MFDNMQTCNVDLEELNKLEEYLKRHEIAFERIDGYDYFGIDRHQICVPCVGEGRKWDVICQFGSYGVEKGLLEICGELVRPDCGNDVEGWLTAEDVISRIERAKK